MGQVSIKTTTATVTTASQKIIDANVERNFLSLQNKSAENSVLIKFGEDFVPAADEVQHIAFTPAVVPTSGSFKLSYDDVETAAIAYDDTYSDVQTALRAIPGLEEVEVLGDFENGFDVTFTGTSGHQPMLLLEIVDNTLSTTSTEVDEIQTIAFSSEPTSGTYKLGYGAEKTSALNYNDDAAAVQTALRLLTGLSAVDVAAAGEGFGFVVTFTGSHADAGMITFSDASTLIDETVEADESQKIFANMVPTEGSYRLQFKGEITDELDFDADATAIQTALRALSTVGATTTVTGTDLVSGMTVAFLGVDGAADQPLIQPYAVNLIRYGEQLRMDVYPSSEGVSAASVTHTVTETTKGWEDTDVVGEVTVTTTGVIDDPEGVVMAPGDMQSYSEAVPVDAVYAVCDDDTALVEIQEG